MYEAISQTNAGGQASQDLLPAPREDRAERRVPLAGPSASGSTSKSFLMEPRRQGVRVARCDLEGSLCCARLIGGASTGWKHSVGSQAPPFASGQIVKRQMTGLEFLVFLFLRTQAEI